MNMFQRKGSLKISEDMFEYGPIGDTDGASDANANKANDNTTQYGGDTQYGHSTSGTCNRSWVVQWRCWPDSMLFLSCAVALSTG